MLGASVNGAELSVRVTGAELPAMSPSTFTLAQKLGARDADAETC